MKTWLQLCAVLVMLLVAATSPRLAHAEPSVGSASTWSSQRILNDIIRRTPGLTTATTTGTGVTVGSSGSATVAAGRGLTVPVPATASASITAGRIAGIAAKAIRTGGWVGVATVVVPWAAEQAGIEVCPPPDFFCKPGPDVPAKPTQGGWWYRPFWSTSLPAVEGFGSHAEVCTAYGARAAAANQTGTVRPLPWSPQVGSTGATTCIAGNGATITGIGHVAQTCPAGSIKQGKDCVTRGPNVPASEPDIAAAVEKGITGKPERIKKAYDAISPTGLPMFLPTDPVTVSVPSVVPVPDRVTTTTQPGPNGSTDTVQTTVKTEVKPQVQGNTLGNTTITYPTTTTTTTTTTNNVTNISHTTTTINNVVNNPVPNSPDVSPDAPPVVDYPGDDPAPDPEKLEIPTDYNREVTQKSILDVLKSWSEPVTETLPDGQAEADAIQAKHDEGIAIVDGISAEGLGLSNWFPTVPTAPCINPQIPNPVTGESVSFPICGFVDTFSKFISGVICFFCVLGCVHQVQSAFRA